MGGGAVQQCPNQPEDPCAKLAREIKEMLEREKGKGEGGTKGLKQRFAEQINGANGPPGSGVGDPEVWNVHDKVIREQQVGLRRRLNQFRDKNCGDKIPIPVDAREWADKSAPQPSEWKRPVSAAPATGSEPSPSLMKRIGKITGLSGTALLIYVIISEGSRLFPPRDLIPIP